MNKENPKQKIPKKNKNEKLVDLLPPVILALLLFTGSIFLIDSIFTIAYTQTSGDCSVYETYYRQSIFFDKGYCKEQFKEEWICLEELVTADEYQEPSFFEKDGWVIMVDANEEFGDISISGWDKFDPPKEFKEVIRYGKPCDTYIKIKRRSE